MMFDFYSIADGSFKKLDQDAFDTLSLIAGINPVQLSKSEVGKLRLVLENISLYCAPKALGTLTDLYRRNLLTDNQYMNLSSAILDGVFKTDADIGELETKYYIHILPGDNTYLNVLMIADNVWDNHFSLNTKEGFSGNCLTQFTMDDVKRLQKYSSLSHINLLECLEKVKMNDGN